jgi:predicted nucleic acid-binding protein
VTACYLDASAIVKLVADEAETEALRQWSGARTTCVTSRVSTVEVPRVLRRKGGTAIELAAGPLEDALRAFIMLELDPSIAERAAGLAPSTLRSIDAIHLASALAIAPELEAIVTYDRRLADAARDAGLRVVAPA